MASSGFNEEIRRASEELHRFSAEAERASRGTAKREQEAERSFSSSLLGGAAGFAASALGGAATPAATAFGATGSFNAAADVAASSVVEALARTSLGSVVAGLTGVGPEINARVNAREQVIRDLTPFANANVPLDDAAVQSLIDVRVAQAERVQALTSRVTVATANDPVTVGLDAAGDKAPAIFDATIGRFVDAVDALSRLVDRIPFPRADGR